MKNIFDDPESGIRFARMGLAAGVIVSVAGNVANVYLTETAVPLGWRIPGAVVWPAFLFLAIEVMVRNRHRTHKLGYLGRALLMSVSVTTFVTSYVNLHSYMVKINDPTIATFAGPIGIDGMMLGCTVFLLAASMVAAKTLPEPALLTEPLPFTVADAETFRISLADMLPQPIEDSLPVSAPPATVRAIATRKPRAQWDAAQVVELAVDGAKATEATAATGIGGSTYGRYTKVAKMLKANPAQNIDVKAEKVPLEHVEMIRKLVSR